MRNRIKIAFVAPLALALVACGSGTAVPKKRPTGYITPTPRVSVSLSPSPTPARTATTAVVVPTKATSGTGTSNNGTTARRPRR